MRFQDLKNKSEFSKHISFIKSEYERTCGGELPQLSHEFYNIFYETGSRKEYEELYFFRRRALLVSTLMCLIYDDDKYLEKLENVIEEIFVERVWAVPAHTPQDDPEPEKMIDLFAAETGQALSEIHELLCDKLSAKTRKLIDTELEISPALVMMAFRVKDWAIGTTASHILRHLRICIRKDTVLI